MPYGISAYPRSSLNDRTKPLISIPHSYIPQRTTVKNLQWSILGLNVKVSIYGDERCNGLTSRNKRLRHCHSLQSAGCIKIIISTLHISKNGCGKISTSNKSFVDVSYISTKIQNVIVHFKTISIPSRK